VKRSRPRTHAGNVAFRLARLAAFLWVGYVTATVVSAILRAAHLAVAADDAALAAVMAGLAGFSWAEWRLPLVARRTR